jgi:hypothetical protein
MWLKFLWCSVQISRQIVSLATNLHKKGGREGMVCGVGDRQRQQKNLSLPILWSSYQWELIIICWKLVENWFWSHAILFYIGSNTACIDDSDCVSLGKPTLWVVYNVRTYMHISMLFIKGKQHFLSFTDFLNNGRRLITVSVLEEYTQGEIIITEGF